MSKKYQAKHPNPPKISEELLESTRQDINNLIQQQWYRNVEDTKYIIHVGPTNSGKTYHAVESLKKADSGAYLCPLRLLAWEVAEKLNSSGHKCSLITGEERVVQDDSKYTACTIEMTDYSKEYDVVVIDECFMICDAQRGASWTKAITLVKAKEIHIITNHEAFDLITRLLKSSGRNFETKEYERLVPLKYLDKPIKQIKPKTVFITFSRLNALIQKNNLEEMGYKTSVLYGNLPPEIKKRQIQRFIDGEVDVVVSTDCIGQGLNLPCDEICFTAFEKFDGVTQRPLTSIEIKQIAGRAGRYGYSDQGTVTASNKMMLKNIKSQLEQKSKLTKIYYGLDNEIFFMFPEEFSLIRRIRYFQEMDIIPEALKNFVRKEDVAKYVELFYILNSVQDSGKLSLEHQWGFIRCPVHETSKDYFKQMISNFLKSNTIVPPKITEMTIINTEDAKSCEQQLHELDLYMYLCNNRDFGGYTRYKEEMLLVKQDLIEKLDAFLIQRKLTGGKKCRLCQEPLPDDFPHKLCQECFYCRF